MVHSKHLTFEFVYYEYLNLQLPIHIKTVYIKNAHRGARRRCKLAAQTLTTAGLYAHFIYIIVIVLLRQE